MMLQNFSYMRIRDRAKLLKLQADWYVRVVKPRRAEWILANGPCVDCGSWEHLEVDHVDPSTKVSHNVWTWEASRRAQELEKCVTRCHTCHRIKSNSELARPTTHGTRAAYQKGCRCSPCIAAAAKYRNERRYLNGTRRKSFYDTISP